VEDRIGRLEPQSAAAVRALRPDEPVLVEGTISFANPQRYGRFVTYVRKSEVRLSKDTEAHWIEDDWVTPKLTLDIPGGTAHISAGYTLLNTTEGKQTKLYHYSGLRHGDKAFVIGAAGPAGTIQADALIGGTRKDYLFKRTGETWAGYVGDAFLILLGSLMVGAWWMMVRGQRRAVAA
jgi:hypothetical protein